MRLLSLFKMASCDGKNDLASFFIQRQKTSPRLFFFLFWCVFSGPEAGRVCNSSVGASRASTLARGRHGCASFLHLLLSISPAECVSLLCGFFFCFLPFFLFLVASHSFLRRDEMDMYRVASRTTKTFRKGISKKTSYDLICTASLALVNPRHNRSLIIL